MLTKQLFILFLISLLTACGTSKVIIQTVPAGAEVYARESGEVVEKSLGVTPLELSNEEIDKLIKSPKNPTVLKIALHGHQTEKIIITDFERSEVTYNFKLKENSHAEFISKMDSTSNSLFEAQRLLRNGNVEKSITILDDLLKNYKESSFINELMGSAYYMKKDFKKSLFYYESAYKYDSKNIDAYKMKQYLENKLNVKRPLASGRL